MLLVVCMFIVMAIWFYTRDDILFKYCVDLKDQSDEAKEWLKVKKIRYISEYRHYRFIRKSNATMFKMIWS